MSDQTPEDTARIVIQRIHSTPRTTLAEADAVAVREIAAAIRAAREEARAEAYAECERIADNEADPWKAVASIRILARQEPNA